MSQDKPAWEPHCEVHYELHIFAWSKLGQIQTSPNSPVRVQGVSLYSTYLKLTHYSKFSKLSILAITQTYQNSIKSRRAATPLYMTQDSNSGVLIQIVYNNLFHILSSNRHTISINSSLSNNDDV